MSQKFPGLSFSLMSLKSSIALQKTLFADSSQQLHRSWNSTWFPVAVRIVDKNLVPSSSRYHKYQHDLPWHSIINMASCGTASSTWPPRAAQTTDINVVSCGSTVHGLQHGLLWHHRPRTSTWPPVAAQVMGIIHMASCGNILTWPSALLPQAERAVRAAAVAPLWVE